MDGFLFCCWHHGGQCSLVISLITSVTDVSVETWSKRAKRCIFLLCALGAGHWAHKGVEQDDHDTILKMAWLVSRCFCFPGNPGGRWIVVVVVAPTGRWGSTTKQHHEDHCDASTF
jgi:hypothetical protein